MTMFTRDEQFTLMTMTAITRSPMIFGGNLPENDSFTNALITNAAVIAVNQNSTNNRLVYAGNHPVWCANVPGSNDKYCALFNKSDANGAVSVRFHDLFLVSSTATVLNLWSGQSMGQVSDSFSSSIDLHGAGLYRITPVGSTPVSNPRRMTGTPFGIGPAYTVGSEYTKAFDGDTSTFYDYGLPDSGWTGLDFGADSMRIIDSIKYYPRNGEESRLIGGTFQGSNTSMFSGYGNLYIIPTAPAAKTWTSVALSLTTPYRYVRYFGPNGGYCDIGEIQFYSNTITGVKTPNTQISLRRSRQSIFRIAGHQFVVPQEFSCSKARFEVYDLCGKCLKRSILKKEIVDLQKDFGVPQGVYLIQIRTMP